MHNTTTEQTSGNDFQPFLEQVDTPRRFAMLMGNVRTRDTDRDETKAMAKRENMETATCSKSGQVVSARIVEALSIMKQMVGKMLMEQWMVVQRRVA